MPDDQLRLASRLDQCRRAVTRFFSREGAPEFAAGGFVESDRNTAFAPDEANELVAVEQWSGGKAPQGCFDRVILLEISGPNHAPIIGAQAEEVPFGPEGVKPFITDQGCHPGARPVAHSVGTVVLMTPHDSAIGLVQAKDTLRAGHRAAVKRVRRCGCAGSEGRDRRRRLVRWPRPARRNRIRCSSARR